MKIGILIINNDNKERVRRLLDDIERYKLAEMEVFLLDNGCARDNEFKASLIQYTISIVYSKNEEPQSFASAVNALILRAKAAKCDWIWIRGDEQLKVKEVIRQIRDKSHDFHVGVIIMRINGSAKSCWSELAYFIWKKLGMRLTQEIMGSGGLETVTKCYLEDSVVCRLKIFDTFSGLNPNLFLEGEIDELILKTLSKRWRIEQIQISQKSIRRKRVTSLGWYFRARNTLWVTSMQLKGSQRHAVLLLLVYSSILVSICLLIQRKRFNLKMFLSGIRDGYDLALGRGGELRYPSSTS